MKASFSEHRLWLATIVRNTLAKLAANATIHNSTLTSALLLTLILGSPAHSQQPHKTLRMACGIPTQSPLFQHLTKVYNQALSPFKITIDLVPMTLDQELSGIAAGTVDASCLRVKNLSDYTDLKGFHVVSTPSYNGKYYVVTRHRQGQSRTTPAGELRTAIVQGHLLLENMLTSQGIQVDSDAAALDVLKQGLADQAVIWEVGLNQYRSTLRQNNLAISHLFLSLPLHAVFQNEHADVAQLLNRRLPSVLEKLSDRVFQFQLSPKNSFEETLTMACHVPSRSDLAKWIMQLYRKTFDQLHYNLELRLMTRQRAAQELIAGRVDLDCARTAQFAELAGPSVLKIPTAVGSAEVNVYSRNSGPIINDYRQLMRSDSLVHVRGSRKIETALTQHRLKSHATLDSAAALKMLIAGRADYYLGFSEETELTSNSAFLREQIYSRGAIDRALVFPFIHARHKKLIPKISQALSEIDTDSPWK